MKMPVLFVGHGLPMNALKTMNFQGHGKSLARFCLSLKPYWQSQLIGIRKKPVPLMRMFLQ